MSDDSEVKVAVSGEGESAYLSEGICGHCGAFVMFRPTKPALITRVAHELDDGDYRTKHTEDVLVGVCARPACHRATVVRRTYEENWRSGDYDGRSKDSSEVVYPRPRSARKQLPDEVPPALRVKYDEAAAIEFLSPTGASFLAGRLVDQALRHRLRLDGGSKRRIRKTGMAELIQAFIDAGHGTEDLHEALRVLQGFRNFAAHPPQPEDAAVLDITQEEATFLLSACREVLDFVYGRPARIAAMKERLAEKKRGEAAGLKPTSTEPAQQPEVAASDDFQATDEDVPF